MVSMFPSLFTPSNLYEVSPQGRFFTRIKRLQALGLKRTMRAYEGLLHLSGWVVLKGDSMDSGTQFP